MATTATPTAVTAASSTQDVPMSLWSLANSLITAYYPSSTVTNVLALDWPATVVVDSSTIVLTGSSQAVSLASSASGNNVIIQTAEPTTGTISGSSSATPGDLTKSTPSSAPEHHGGSAGRNLGIILGVVLGIAALLILGLVVWCLFRRTKAKRNAEKRRSGLVDSEAASLRRPDMTEDTSYPPLPTWLGAQPRNVNRQSASHEKRPSFQLPETIQEVEEENPFMSPRERANAARGFNKHHPGPAAPSAASAGLLGLAASRQLGPERQPSRSTMGESQSFHTVDDRFSAVDDHDFDNVSLAPETHSNTSQRSVDRYSPSMAASAPYSDLDTPMHGPTPPMAAHTPSVMPYRAANEHQSALASSQPSGMFAGPSNQHQAPLHSQAANGNSPWSPQMSAAPVAADMRYGPSSWSAKVHQSPLSSHPPPGVSSGATNERLAPIAAHTSYGMLSRPRGEHPAMNSSRGQQEPLLSPPYGQAPSAAYTSYETPSRPANAPQAPLPTESQWARQHRPGNDYQALLPAQTPQRDIPQRVDERPNPSQVEIPWGPRYDAGTERQAPQPVHASQRHAPQHADGPRVPLGAQPPFESSSRTVEQDPVPAASDSAKRKSAQLATEQALRPPSPAIPAHMLPYVTAAISPHNPFLSAEDPEHGDEDESSPSLPRKSSKRLSSAPVHYPSWAEISGFDFTAASSMRSSSMRDDDEHDLGHGYHRAEFDDGHYYDDDHQMRGLYEGT